IDHLGADVLGRELVGGFEHVYDHRAPCHDRYVVAFTQRVADIERQRRDVIGDFLLRIPIYTGRLEEYDRIRIADRSEQQAVRPRWRGGAYDANPRHVSE